jgi:hypothetical protein
MSLTAAILTSVLLPTSHALALLLPTANALAPTVPVSRLSRAPFPLLSSAGEAEEGSLEPVPAAAATAHSSSAALPTWLICVVAGLQSACFGVIGTALAPALRSAGLAPAEIALTRTAAMTPTAVISLAPTISFISRIAVGRLGSASALLEVLLSGSFGKVADAIGRKPILMLAPGITVLARSTVVLHPTINVLLGARMATTLVVPMYWLAFQAA